MESVGLPISDARQPGKGEMDLREALVAGAPEGARAPDLVDGAAPNRAPKGSREKRENARLVKVDAPAFDRIAPPLARFERGQNRTAPEQEAGFRERHRMIQRGATRHASKSRSMSSLVACIIHPRAQKHIGDKDRRGCNRCPYRHESRMSLIYMVSSARRPIR